MENLAPAGNRDARYTSGMPLSARAREPATLTGRSWRKPSGMPT